MTAVVLAAVAVIGLHPPLGVRPAGAAPPPVTHDTLVDTDPVDTTPHVIDGRTEAVLDLGATVVVGGTFTEVKDHDRPDRFPRRNLFAYDKATGRVSTTFAPNPDGRVTALLRAPDGHVLVAGQFKRIGGRDVPYVAKLNAHTGAVMTGFAPRPNGMVFDMHLARGHLYLGGAFGRLGSSVRTGFGAVHPATGAVRTASDVAFTAAPAGANHIRRFDITPDGTRLVAIGNFGRVGGHDRPDIAMLHLNAGGGGTVAAWRTGAYADGTCGPKHDQSVYDVDISPDGRWFVVVTTGGPHGPTRLCDSAARWEIDGTGSAPTWVNWTGGDTLTSVAITGAAVYVAGHQRWLDNPDGRNSKGPGAVDRPGIGALSPSTGRALAWNPTRERGLQAPRLVPTADGMYVLSDSSRFAGEWHPRLVHLPLTSSGGPARPSAPGRPVVTAATAGSVTLTWAAPATSGARPLTGYSVVVRSGAIVIGGRSTGTARTTTVNGLPGGRALTFTVIGRSSAGEGEPSVESAPALPPFTGIDAFTDRQMRDLRGRPATAAEKADWRTRVGGGTLSSGAAIDSVMRSDSVERIGAITRLYRAYFLRTPDAAGLRYWAGRTRTGMSINAASTFFAASPEFRARYGALGDHGFVRLVYRNVLDRNPDPAGLTYWVDRLRTGTGRGRLMTLFSESPENVTRHRHATDVLLVVHLLLDRAPTAQERSFLEQALATGTTRADLAQGVIAGEEYTDRI